jgi:hypothetical protein
MSMKASTELQLQRLGSRHPRALAEQRDDLLQVLSELQLHYATWGLGCS